MTQTKLLIQLVSLLGLLVTGCSKSSGPSNSNTGPGGGNAPLLSKEIIITSNADKSEYDSVQVSLQYNSNNAISQTAEVMYISVAGAVQTTTITYNLAYSGTTLAGLTGTVVQATTFGAMTASSTTNVNTTFHSNGGSITSYVQQASTTGDSDIPSTTTIENDSAVLSYDGSGNLSGYTIYAISPGQTTYSTASVQTFTYNGGNLSKWVNVVYVVGIPEDTVTTTYSYDSKVVAAQPLYYPGVIAHSVNNVIESQQVTTGITPQTVTINYTNTYNSANQPVSSTGTVSATPASADPITQQTVTYTYN